MFFHQTGSGSSLNDGARARMRLRQCQRPWSVDDYPREGRETYQVSMREERRGDSKRAYFTQCIEKSSSVAGRDRKAMTKVHCTRAYGILMDLAASRSWHSSFPGMSSASRSRE